MGKLSADALTQLLIQLALMLVIGRVFAELARRMKQPAVVGEIIAGIILGPTILGMIEPSWFDALFPLNQVSGFVLAAIVQISVVMLLFIAGLEVDLHIVFQQGRVSLTSDTRPC